MKIPKQKLNEILFTCTIEDFHLVPYTRMTRRSKFVSKSAKRYMSNQEALKWAFRENLNDWVYEGAVSIAFTVHYADKRVRDLDNCMKALGDALQGIVIKNDSQIVETGKCRIFRDGKERVTLTLRKIDH